MVRSEFGVNSLNPWTLVELVQPEGGGGVMVWGIMPWVVNTDRSSLECHSQFE